MLCCSTYSWCSAKVLFIDSQNKIIRTMSLNKITKAYSSMLMLPMTKQLSLIIKGSPAFVPLKKNFRFFDNFKNLIFKGPRFSHRLQSSIYFLSLKKKSHTVGLPSCSLWLNKPQQKRKKVGRVNSFATEIRHPIIVISFSWI